MVSPPFLMSFW